MDKGKEREESWNNCFKSYTGTHPELAKQWKDAWSGKLPDGWEKALPVFSAENGAIPTRKASGSIINAVAPVIWNLIGGSADLVLSDCSPNVSGQWELDVARQLGLVERTLAIAEEILSSNGKAVAKIFQGPGFEELLKDTRERFNSVKLIKPPASRRKSAEIYLLASGPKRSMSENAESDS